MRAVAIHGQIFVKICGATFYVSSTFQRSTVNAGAHTLYLRQFLSLLLIFITGRYISPHHYSNGTKTIRVTRALHESQGQRCAPRFILFLSLHHIPRISPTLNPTLSWCNNTTVLAHNLRASSCRGRIFSRAISASNVAIVSFLAVHCWVDRTE